MFPEHSIRQAFAVFPPRLPTISIAMCTYNGERYLREQLESFTNQTRLPDQLVVCDDGSTDSTRLILKDFARTAPFPVELRFNTRTLGISKNFEQSLSKCTADYIALCDQDDRWLPNKLQCLADLLEANPDAGYACSNAMLIDKHGRPLQHKLWDALRVDPPTLVRQDARVRRAYLVRQNCVTGATMMLRREKLRNFLAPLPASWVHDHWLVVLCEILKCPGCLTPELLTEYRLHPGQTIGVESRNWFQRYRSVAERAKRCLRTEQRYFDLQAHLETTELAKGPELAIWTEVLRRAQQELADRRKELELPWWQRKWIRIVRSQRRAA